MKTFAYLVCGVLLIASITSEVMKPEETIEHEALSYFLNGPEKEFFNAFHLVFQKEYDLNSDIGLKKFENFKINLESFKSKRRQNPFLQIDSSLDSAPQQYEKIKKYEQRELDGTSFKVQNSIYHGSLVLNSNCLTVSDSSPVVVDLQPCTWSDSQNFVINLFYGSTKTGYMHKSTNKFLIVDSTKNPPSLTLSYSPNNRVYVNSPFEGILQWGSNNCVYLNKSGKLAGDGITMGGGISCLPITSPHAVNVFQYDYAFQKGTGNLKMWDSSKTNTPGYNYKCLTSYANSGAKTVAFNTCNGSQNQLFTVISVPDKMPPSAYVQDYWGNVLTINFMADKPIYYMAKKNLSDNTIIQEFLNLESDIGTELLPFALYPDSSKYFGTLFDLSTFPNAVNDNYNENSTTQNLYFTGCLGSFTC